MKVSNLSKSTILSQIVPNSGYIQHFRSCHEGLEATVRLLMKKRPGHLDGQRLAVKLAVPLFDGSNKAEPRMHTVCC